MGCFGSASSKQNNQGGGGSGGSDEDKVSQKKRSDAITKQLQKDKQVTKQTISSYIARGKLKMYFAFYFLGLQSNTQATTTRCWRVWEVDNREADANIARKRVLGSREKAEN